MKMLTSANAIRRALRDLEPSRIAVAYVGRGWSKFISTKHLREIVLSPTLGTNPKAVEELMQELGDKNVHFIEELHSKFYIGPGAALLGSCNLSDGGMGEGGRLETAVVLRNESAVRQLEELFELYRASARKGRFATREKKIGRLRELQDQLNRAESSGLAHSRGASPSITEYASELDRIHVVWYQDDGDEVDEQLLGEVIPKVAEVGSDRYFADWIQFQEQDDVLPGDWLLCWECNDEGLPEKGSRIYWLYVHDVVSGALKSVQYPKLAGEAAREFQKRPAIPFKLDRVTKAAIQYVLASGEFPALLSRDESAWRLKPADKVTSKFLQAVRNRVRLGQL